MIQRAFLTAVEKRSSKSKLSIYSSVFSATLYLWSHALGGDRGKKKSERERRGKTKQNKTNKQTTQKARDWVLLQGVWPHSM